jgi:hypothetical protein
MHSKYGRIELNKTTKEIQKIRTEINTLVIRFLFKMTITFKWA